MKKQLDAYIEYLQSTKSASENTVRNYRYDLQRFINFLEAEKILLGEVNFETLDKFLSGKQKNETKNRWLSAIHSFYEYLYSRKKIGWSKDDGESTVKDYKLLPVSGISPITSDDLPTVGEASILRDAIDATDDPEQALMIIYLISSSGARPTEILTLNMDDIVGSKGNYTNLIHRKWRYVGRLQFGRETMQIFRKFVNDRIKKINHNNGGIFDWNYQQWYYRLGKIRKMAGIEKNITSKSFRHLWFTIAEQKNMKITVRLDRGGHKTTKMLIRYSHLSEDEKSKEFDRVFGKGVFKEVLR